MYSEKSSSDPKIGKDEFVETVERRKSVSEEATELSGIEATAASRAAWLIALTVSIGGFLFGAFHPPHSNDGKRLTKTQVTTLAISPPFWLPSVTLSVMS